MNEEQISQPTDFTPEPSNGNNGGESGGGESTGGQGRGFRRRRRRGRPSGAAQPGAAAAVTGEGNSGAETIQLSGGNEGASQAAASEGAPQGNNTGGNNQNRIQPNRNGAQGQGQGQAFGRRKNRRKKFFGDRQGGAGQPGAPAGNRADRPNGNAGYANNSGYSNGGGNGNGGFGNRRKGKGRGGRGFVGPMDHMYREGNGNYSEAPPSTISVNGNQNGHRRNNNNQNMHDSGHQAQFLGRFYEPPPPVIAEDAPTHVFCLIDDLFFTAKINEAARKLGVKVAFVKSEKEDLARIAEASEDGHTALLLVDLNNLNAKPLAVIAKLHAKMKRSVSIVGFLSNLQGDLKAKAMEAGCDSVMPRSAFSQGLPNLLRRYGLVEKENEAEDAQHAYF